MAADNLGMRKPRVVVPGMPHHVFNRGNNKRRLFSYPRDYRRMLWDIENALEKVGAMAINALVLMANHFHLIAVPSSKDSLAKFTKSFAQNYAVYRNRNRKTTGKLFEERYECKPILSEAQLAITTAYIELNPLRAFVVKDPEDYPWSTYRRHAGDERGSQISPDLLTPSSWYLGLSSDPVKRAVMFREFVEHCRRRDRKPDEIEVIERKEREAEQVYTMRLERPNRTRAHEGIGTYTPKNTRD